MKKLSAIALLCGIILLRIGSVKAGEPDLEIQKIIKLKVYEKDNQYALSSKVSFEQIYLSKRSLDSNEHFIAESYYGKVSKLHATFRGKRVSKKIS